MCCGQPPQRTLPADGQPTRLLQALALATRYGKPGNDSPIATAMKFATNPEPVYTYDPDKAKSLLKKAGMENLKIDLSAADAAFAGQSTRRRTCSSVATAVSTRAIRACIVRAPANAGASNAR